MKWFAEAPANIALIKYMGKSPVAGNTPINNSLSYTLNDLLSFVELEAISGTEDFWEPLSMPASHPFTISDTAQQKFLRHLTYLKQQLQYTGAFIVRSCNNFPADCGLASSASSFAALTICTVRAICELQDRRELSSTEQAALSQHGSGSSCRSFFAPWALWQTDNKVAEITLPYNDLIHHVIITSREAKSISSSEAHQRITTSPLFADRGSRTNSRLQNLLTALEQRDWPSCFTIAWEEFHDMHELFATSKPPFSYITQQSQQVLDDIARYWHKHGDGPIVTMDAGPNIHLLFRADQRQLAEETKALFLHHHDVI